MRDAAPISVKEMNNAIGNVCSGLSDHGKTYVMIGATSYPTKEQAEAAI